MMASSTFGAKKENTRRLKSLLPPVRIFHHNWRIVTEPLHEAVSNGHSKVLELLLQHGGDVNCRANGGYTPLHIAACSGHMSCTRVLLANEADISIIDEWGKTPMQTAELSSKHAIVKGVYLFTGLEHWTGLLD